MSTRFYTVDRDYKLPRSHRKDRFLELRNRREINNGNKLLNYYLKSNITYYTYKYTLFL